MSGHTTNINKHHVDKAIETPSHEVAALKHQDDISRVVNLFIIDGQQLIKFSTKPVSRSETQDANANQKQDANKKDDLSIGLHNAFKRD